MTRTRIFGFALLGGSVLALIGAIGFGVAAAQELMPRTAAIAAAVGFGLAAEAMFWTGGALLGLSFFAKRGGFLQRLLTRKPRPAPEGEGR